MPQNQWRLGMFVVYCNKLPTKRATTNVPMFDCLPSRLTACLSYTWRASFHLVSCFPLFPIFFALPDTFFTYSVVDILRDWRQPRGVNKWKWNWRHFVGPSANGAMCLPFAICHCRFGVLIMIGNSGNARCHIRTQFIDFFWKQFANCHK